MKAMNVDARDIGRVVLSNWHSDHTAGLLSLLRYRGMTGESSRRGHSSRSTGIAPPPNYDKIIRRLPADPTFEEIEELGGRVETNVEGHAVADGMVWVSGEISGDIMGILGGVRWVDGAGRAGGRWIKEEVSFLADAEESA
jgi:7,8-dihydropterin-6-yl-methyl-4-(beta-D-ribofuranosyl)aminobenzene 5'-phosphate synthase